MVTWGQSRAGGVRPRLLGSPTVWHAQRLCELLQRSVPGPQRWGQARALRARPRCCEARPRCCEPDPGVARPAVAARRWSAPGGREAAHERYVQVARLERVRVDG